MQNYANNQLLRDLRIKQLLASGPLRITPGSTPGLVRLWRNKYDGLRFKDYASFSQLEEIIDKVVEIYNRVRHHGATADVGP